MQSTSAYDEHGWSCKITDLPNKMEQSLQRLNYCIKEQTNEQKKPSRTLSVHRVFIPILSCTGISRGQHGHFDMQNASGVNTWKSAAHNSKQ